MCDYIECYCTSEAHFYSVLQEALITCYVIVQIWCLPNEVLLHIHDWCKLPIRGLLCYERNALRDAYISFQAMTTCEYCILLQSNSCNWWISTHIYSGSVYWRPYTQCVTHTIVTHSTPHHITALTVIVSDINQKATNLCRHGYLRTAAGQTEVQMVMEDIPHLGCG